MSAYAVAFMFIHQSKAGFFGLSLSVSRGEGGSNKTSLPEVSCGHVNSKNS